MECILYARLILGLEIQDRIQEEKSPHSHVAYILVGVRKVVLYLQIIKQMRNVFGSDTCSDEN